MQAEQAKRTFRWLDSGIHRQNPIEPLAIDEALGRAMALPHARPTIHLWIYDKAFYLGRRDAKLPYLEAALRQFSQEGFAAVLRSSGGACVPLDAGVLNMAFLLPDTHISIDAFFQTVSDMLRVGLAPFGPLTFGEVTGSYCAGEYDFAIGGKKLGGMAQRRIRHGSILQLCINVDDRPRGAWMERFYALAGLDEMAQQRPIPSINGATIGSLAEACGRPVTMEETKHTLLQAIRSVWPIEEESFAIDRQLLDESREHLTKRLGLFAFQPDEMQAANWRLTLE